MSFRTYRDVAGADRSGLAEQVGELRTRVTRRLKDVDHVVAVLSGKGGVGKSYVSALLAVAAVQRGLSVGVLDADLASPTVSRLLEATKPLALDDAGDAVRPGRGIEQIKVVSSDMILPEKAPLRWSGLDAEQFIWRGVLEHGMVREFLSDVAWGELDVLFVDLPPGAAAAVDLVGLVPDLAGAVAVTIPTDEALQSVARAIQASRDAGIRLLGIVENMSGYRCAACGDVRPLFPGTAGDELSRQFHAPVLARLPLQPGQPVAAAARQNEALVAAVIEAIA